MTLDLSQYALDIVKGLASEYPLHKLHLHSLFPETLYDENIELGWKSWEHGKDKGEGLHT